MPPASIVRRQEAFQEYSGYRSAGSVIRDQTGSVLLPFGKHVLVDFDGLVCDGLPAEVVARTLQFLDKKTSDGVPPGYAGEDDDIPY